MTNYLRFILISHPFFRDSKRSTCETKFVSNLKGDLMIVISIIIIIIIIITTTTS